MTSTNKSLARPNAIFLNVILAIIAFILIIYLRNIYVTIIAVVVVVGVYFVFDTKALFKINDDPATPYIESQPMDASAEGTESGSVGSVVPVVRNFVNEVEVEEKIGCSDINLNDSNVVKISSYNDFATNRTHAKDSSKIFVLMNDIDCNGELIDGSVYSNFNASFEGNCFSIKNFIIINTSGGSNVGFFGKVKATDTPIYIKNITFTDFAFNINTDSKRIGIFAHILSEMSSPSENDITFENVTVHLNNPSLITIAQSQTETFQFGVFSGVCLNGKILDCNVILSSRLDIYLNSDNLKGISYGVFSGLTRNSSLMACSSNLIGSDIVLNITKDVLQFGLLCGKSSSNESSYINLLNNMIILKDSSLKTNYTLEKYGYLLGVCWGNPTPPTFTAKNNTIMSFVDGFFSNDILSKTDIDVEENNKINKLASVNPSDVSIKDQIYGMQIDSTTYWKKVYYVYYEGDTSNMGCRYYDVFNFWKNTELGTYCMEDNMCNTNKYGACDSGEGRRGWVQFTDNVSVNCDNNGGLTYTLLNNKKFDSYEAIILDDGITFDGGNYTIINTGGVWNSLFTCIERSYKINVTIKNVTIDLGGKKLNSRKGAILGNSVFNLDNVRSFANYNITIENCHVTNGSMLNHCGGIVGLGFCSNPNSEGSIVNCSNSCTISGDYAGGICGSNSGKYGKIEIRSCWNTGSMSSGTLNGGILGYNGGSPNTTSDSHIFIFNCYNTGDFNTSSGGICATTSASSNKTGERIMILNCYSDCDFADLTTFSDYTYGGIVAAANTTFQPYVLYCDVYLTYINNDTNQGATYITSDEPNLITRNGYRSNSGYTGININTIGRMETGTTTEHKLHTKNFNLVSLKSLLNTLPYDFISPVWNTDNLTIPDY